MSLRQIGTHLGWIGILVAMGCASHPPFPDSSLTGRIVEVKISESLSPKEIAAKQGDEVRWLNTTGAPVDIAFVDSLDGGHVSCQKGFVAAGWGYLFHGIGSGPEFLMVATVHENKYASVCFSAPGRYDYTVRGGTTEAGKLRRIAGTVTIE